MSTDSISPGASGEPGKTVQDYIDETPIWADATAVSYSPLTDMQWFMWWLAAAGKFFEGMVVFMTGVALPLMAKEFTLGATEKGVVAAASLFGILIGATALGGLADRYGRKEMFIIEMALVRAIHGREPQTDHPGFGSLVLAGPRHLRHRHFHSHHPRHPARRHDRAPAQRRRARSERYPRH